MAQYLQAPNRHDSVRRNYSRTKCLSDCFARQFAVKWTYQTESWPGGFASIVYQYATLGYDRKNSIAFTWGVGGGGRLRILTRFDSGDNKILQLAIRTRFDTIRDKIHRLPIRFAIDGLSEKPYFARLSTRYDAYLGSLHRLSNRFGCLPLSLLTRLPVRLDVYSTGRGLQNARKMAFVRPGWRITARELESQVVYDLGFIDADSPSRLIDDIYLPNGEYEIFVTTSSLFWQDAMDRNIYQLSVRPGVPVSNLPIIHGLRSSLSMGTRTIHWSASQSDVDDCVFGVWFSKTSPVDISRTPDQVIWYFPEAGEYTTSFEQREPTYVAVAAMRTGNAPETGPASELFLDWDDTPPRRPDGIVLLDFVIEPPETTDAPYIEQEAFGLNIFT